MESIEIKKCADAFQRACNKQGVLVKFAIAVPCVSVHFVASKLLHSFQKLWLETSALMVTLLPIANLPVFEVLQDRSRTLRVLFLHGASQNAGQSILLIVLMIAVPALLLHAASMC